MPLAFITLYVALHLHGLFEMPFTERLSLQPWVFGTAIALFLSFWVFLSRGRFSISAESGWVLLALSAYLVVAALGLLLGEASTAGFVTWSACVGLLALVFFAQAIRWEEALYRINRLVFYSSVILVIASLPLYFSALFSIGSKVMDPSTWEPGIGYMLDRGRYLRFVGFAENPNFFALYVAPALFMAILVAKTGFQRLLGWLIIIAFLMTISLGMSIGSVIALALYFMRSAERGKSSRVLKTIKAGFIVAFVLGGLVLLTPFGGVFTERVEFTGAEGRMELVSKSIESGGGISMIGAGLRHIDSTTGKFSHNTYIDLLVETGVLGMLFYLTALALVSAMAYKLLSDDLAAPWALTWFAFLFHAGAHSLSYSPFLFLMVAVIIGRYSTLRLRRWSYIVAGTGVFEQGSPSSA